MYRFLLIALVISSLCCRALADPLKCEAGGRRAMSDYQTAIDLLKEERQLSTDEENRVVALLEKSVKSKCSQAALV